MTADPLSISEASTEAPDKLALDAGSRRFTYRELAERVADSPLAPGRPHAFVADATPESVITFLACLEARAPAVPLHPRLPPTEHRRLAARAETLSGDAALLFTSGTSAEPKGVRLSREAFVASAAASAAHLGWTGEDAWLLCMPLGHIGGLSILTRCLIARRPVVLLPRFETGPVLEVLARRGATLLSVVPAMLDALLEADSGDLLARARAVIVGGAPCPEPLAVRARARGVRVVTTYGMTETCAMVTLDGRVLPGVEATIVDGTIRLQGPSLFTGYLGEPARCPDLPFDTGDLGHFAPDGTLVVDGRRSDLIITGGENVSPLQVEAVLARLPGVREVMVHGVPDDRYGQCVAAALVIDRTTYSEALLFEAARKHLAPFQVPRVITYVTALPRTAAGKLDRRPKSP